MGADVENEGGRNRSLWGAIFKASQSASPHIVTDSKGEASVSDQLHDHVDHVPVWKQAKQLASKATIPCKLSGLSCSPSLSALMEQRVNTSICKRTKDKIKQR